MQTNPNAMASSEDFEFAALSEARHYRHAILKEFSHYLRGNIIEIGAGIGQITKAIATVPEVSHLVAVEPDPQFASRHIELHPNHSVLGGTIDSVDPKIEWNAIVSVNVLEHIEEDEMELTKYAELLKRQGGHLCLLTPARPEIYAPIDKDFGHFRRYTKTELRRKLIESGFKDVTLFYFNFVGYFAWFLNFCLLRKRTFEINKVRAYDNLVFPFVHILEYHCCRPPIGQSLMAIAKTS